MSNNNTLLMNLVPLLEKTKDIAGDDERIITVFYQKGGNLHSADCVNAILEERFGDPVHKDNCNTPYFEISTRNMCIFMNMMDDDPKDLTEHFWQLEQLSNHEQDENEVVATLNSMFSYQNEWARRDRKDRKPFSKTMPWVHLLVLNSK